MRKSLEPIKYLLHIQVFWLQCVNCEVAGAGSHLHHYLDCCLAEGLWREEGASLWAEYILIMMPGSHNN